jgi:hypothetical protein
MKRICWLKKTLRKRYKFAFLRELFEYKDDNEDEVDAVLVQSLELAKTKVTAIIKSGPSTVRHKRISLRRI